MSLAKEIINHRTELDQMCLGAEKLARCCPLDNSQKRCHGVPIFSGMLDTLPLELQNLIFVQLDLQSLTDLRRVSQNSRLAVDDLFQYRTIRTQAPELLRAVLSHGIARWTLIEDLFDALTSQACTLCGDFGAFIYLLSCSRACYVCISYDPQFCPQLASSVKAKYALDDRALAGLPTLRSLPGSSAHQQNTHWEQLALVDRKAAKEAAMALKYSLKAKSGYCLWVNRSKPMTCLQLIMLQNNDAVDRQVHPLRTVANDTQTPQFVGIIRVPWLSRVSGKLEWGVSCKGCHRRPTNFKRRATSKIMYSQDDFLKHLECCTAGLPNERWTKSLTDMMRRSEYNEARGRWKPYGNPRSLDPCFLDDTVALVLQAYRRSQIDIEGTDDVDGAGETDTTGAPRQVDLSRIRD